MTNLNQKIEVENREEIEFVHLADSIKLVIKNAIVFDTNAFMVSDKEKMLNHLSLCKVLTIIKLKVNNEPYDVYCLQDSGP